MSCIKGLNKITGIKLYSLKDKTYSTFFELLIDCKENAIGIADLTILIKLNFFSEFGSIGKLLKFVEIYNELYQKKTIKKDKEYLVKKLYLKEFCAKETEKQYTGFDSYKCLSSLIDKMADEDISIKDKLLYQLQYFGYVDIVDTNINENIWLVTDMVERSKNKIVDLYCINNGEKIKAKVRSKIFSSNPFNKGDLLSIDNFMREGKWSINPDTQEWEKSTTVFENILNEYNIERN